MLTQLSIRNVVLIEKLELDFVMGLSVLTGETGAGKSILLDSLGLGLGARSEASVIRAGADQASVSLTFPNNILLVHYFMNKDYVMNQALSHLSCAA